MGISEIYRSIARLFSVKGINIANQESFKSPEKLTNRQEPTNNSKTTLNKVKSFVGFLDSSRSRRYCTGSKTLVDSSSPPSAGDITVETFLQVHDQASLNDAVSSNGFDDFTGPSFADTVLPILMAITTGSNETTVHDFAPASPLAISSVEPIVENNLENSGDQLNEVAQVAEHAASIHSNNHIYFGGDTIARPPVPSTPSIKVIFDDSFDNGSEHASSVHENEAVDIEDHTIYYASVTQWTERVIVETLVSSELVVGVTEPIVSNVLLPVSTSESSAKTSGEVDISNELSETNEGSCVDPVVQDEPSSLSLENITDVGGQSHPFPEHIDGYYFDDTTGPSAAVTTVPFVPRSNPGIIIKAPLVQPSIENEDPESFYRQVYARCDSATGRLDSPDSYYPVRRQASLSQYDADVEPMLNHSENLLEINDSDDRHYVLPHPDDVELDEEPIAFPEVTIPVADVKLAILEQGVAHSEPAPEIIHTDHNLAPEDVVTELGPETQSYLMERALFISELEGQGIFISDLMEQTLFISELEEQGIFIPELSEQGIVPAELNTPKPVEQRPEQVQGSEEIVKEIIRTQMIPHYHQFRTPFLPPGLVIPWGPNNIIPIQLIEFKATDPWLPNPFNDPLGYSRLNEVQKRWCQLELYYKQTIFWICKNSTAANHLENNPRNIFYCFNNICGYFGCQAKDCRHPQVCWVSLYRSYEKWKQHRTNQLELFRKNVNQQAAFQQQYGRPLANIQASQGQLSEQDAFAQQAIAEITTRQHATAQRAAQKAPKKRPAELQLLVQEDSYYEPPAGLNAVVQALEQAFLEEEAREQKALEQEAFKTYAAVVEGRVSHYGAQIKQSFAQEAQNMAVFQESNSQHAGQEAGSSIDNRESGSSQLRKSHSSNLPLVTDLARSADSNDDMISGGLGPFGSCTEDSRSDQQLLNYASLRVPEKIVLDPKMSRWNTMFPPNKEGSTSEVGTPENSAPYSDGSNGQSSVSDKIGKATKSTPDTSLEGSLKVSQLVLVSKQEANDHSVIYTPNDVEEGDLYSASPLKARDPAALSHDVEEDHPYTASRLKARQAAFIALANAFTLDKLEEDDLYSASPRRLPDPAFSARISPFPPPASKELVEDSIAAGEKDASELYDDEGFFVEDVVKYLNGFVIEGSTGNPDDRSSDDEEFDEESDEKSDDEEARDEMSNDEESEDEETQVLPQAGTAKFGQRIAISSKPATSGLASAFKRQRLDEARGIFHTAPLGPEDHPDILLDREILPILQGDARELLLSNMFREIDHAKNHIANQWMNNQAQQGPNAPNVDYVTIPRRYGYDDENIQLPRAMAEEMNEAEQKIWTMGMAYAEHNRLNEIDDPAKFTSEMHKVQPALINRSWKPEVIGKCVGNLNVTHFVLLPGDDDPFSFDDGVATF
ncbi:7423d44a-366b-44d8-980f-442008a4598f [Sclerotinia trifoliorum]|uniref:7423d44a-366b-44d8-980f-442008a4598f n=1 Tax=Sclerotinia trifoliorum TaxID=28548 RepID=A0A8H2ZJR0_9HELO|nr:7423d44a-366b-44d8-980f-442008a4598f [Sclerotinia trifoliorum]